MYRYEQHRIRGNMSGINKIVSQFILEYAKDKTEEC
jgi:hypothetical protein